jgi:hypothetical protein
MDGRSGGPQVCFVSAALLFSGRSLYLGFTFETFLVYFETFLVYFETFLVYFEQDLAHLRDSKLAFCSHSSCFLWSHLTHASGSLLMHAPRSH